MINRERLLRDLQKRVAEVEQDLKEQLERLPEAKERLLTEYETAFRVGRTSAAAPQWLGERVTQSAVAWVLGTVFVRFCEDNFLLRAPYLTGPDAMRQTHAQESHDQFMAEDAARTHRDWLLAAFEKIGESPAGRMLFDRHNPLWQIPLSHEGAKRLIDFWRLHEEGEDGGTHVVHDFRDQEWDTRFLGDLYQDLSEEAKDKYALLQTPEFVEEFILDRTLKKALGHIGYDVVKMIDPTCGSGHFLLGAFHRILAEWERKAPSDDVHKRVAGALNAVHGVDINPYAVAIARFRLIIAALKAAGISNLEKAGNFTWPLHVATGDALLKSQQGRLFEEGGDAEAGYEFWFGTEDVADHLDILKPGRYHVVVGNPPYIGVADAGLRDTYRRLYRNVCHGKYVLSVPFMQRFFELAVRDETGDGRVQSGYVGQITSNSFMKREFGEKLVAGYLKSSVDLVEVIDSSGAYIPGHGTPTVIVVGRNRSAKLGAKTVRAVRSVQGEPKIPDDPANGYVWREIVECIDGAGKSAGTWISVDNLNREDCFGQHPWVLADGGLETISEIRRNAKISLKKGVRGKVGITAVTGEDDLYLLPKNGAGRRLGIGRLQQVIVGDSVRDHCAASVFDAVWTYSDEFEVASISDDPGAEKLLSVGKSVIRNRKRFGTLMANRGLSWYEWQELYKSKLSTPLTIAFAEVATHNHFILDRGGNVFNRTAPVIKLPEGATEEDHLQLLGLLNSSTACFWLKQMCQDKPSNGVKRGLESEKWTVRYQFNATNVQEFPLPATYPLARATELDSLAQQLQKVSLAAVAGDTEKPPTAEALASAKAEWHQIRARMIAVQEELDWEVYGIYGLHEDLTAPVDALPPEGLALGERAFEIDLGRKVESGEAKTEWFRRHNSTRIIDIPEGWPELYKEVVRRRLKAMGNSAVIGLIERPEYKRRWLTDGWGSQQQAALREWLLSRMERRELWFETASDGVERPRTRSIPELVDELGADSEFTGVAALYAPGKELSDVVPELVEDQHVPFLAALRYQEAALEKKRYVWEKVWGKQRAEDAATAAGDHEEALRIRKETPVPPKYTTKDFRRDSYGAQRGGLDVPKERFISYSRTLSPAIEVLGWGGWNHEEQAVALTETIAAREYSGNWEREDFIPYLAGLLELLPWVKKWHPGEEGVYEEALAEWQQEHAFAVTTDELRAWRPAKPVRKAAKRVAPKRAKRAKQVREAAEAPTGVAAEPEAARTAEADVAHVETGGAGQ
ncbi:BREX-2 system adenine-specific DNA-methyltransferase PglX [Streptomyces sp. WMMB303]|uniref:BREX-2 system adenine-specific DNA-methyltransferase PglX n=1 Tax=Streptomyces sp. WMMB303 TaxID=3034154 RepID=UPI0023EAA10C|nr:BREX-2 system adenine-specific DNA-methyltransferase PglX [Streptomyces sp. WMMB303]MDF4251127.1 BREX-2 system adenine-specific DNA-methyltransferase PglX [Streptomyces sp. WMMB303]